MTIPFEKENRNVHLIIDCDDVLLDWQRGFRSYLFEHFGMTVDPLGPTSWSLTDWLDVPESTCLELIALFNASEEFGNLIAMPDAAEAIHRLAHHQLTVLTSCSSAPAVVNRRKENLKREFGDAISRVVCLDLGESKAGWLNVLRPGIWIEDNYRNALLGYEAGHKTFMLRRRHNRADEPASNRHVMWIDDWRPLVSFFS